MELNAIERDQRVRHPAQIQYTELNEIRIEKGIATLYKNGKELIKIDISGWSAVILNDFN